MTKQKNRSTMEEAALAVYFHAAQMIKAGKSYEEVERELVQQGISPQTAKTMLRKLDASRANVARRSGWRNLSLGMVIFGLGLTLEMGLISDPALGIGSVFAWAAMLIGGFWLARGIMQIIGV